MRIAPWLASKVLSRSVHVSVLGARRTELLSCMPVSLYTHFTAPCSVNTSCYLSIMSHHRSHVTYDINIYIYDDTWRYNTRRCGDCFEQLLISYLIHYLNRNLVVLTLEVGQERSRHVWRVGGWQSHDWAHMWQYSKGDTLGQQFVHWGLHWVCKSVRRYIQSHSHLLICTITQSSSTPFINGKRPL